MEIKKLLISLTVPAVLLMSAAAVGAADNVVYENSGTISASQEKAEQISWGNELYTKCVLDADVKFDGEGSGITLINADGTKDGTSIVAVNRNDKLTMAASGMGSYIYYIEVDTEKTYHLSITGVYGVQNGIVDMRVDTYAEDGSIEASKDYFMILMQSMYASSGIGPAGVRIEPGTKVSNLRMTELVPDAMDFVAPPAAVQPGSTTQLDVRLSREDSGLEYPADIHYSVEGEGAAISADGILTVDKTAPEGVIKVSASADNEKWGTLTAEAEISIVSSDIFTLNNAVFSEDGTVLEEITAVRNYFYDGTAAFVVSVYDGDGTLCGSFVKYVPVKAINSNKETPVVLGYTLPEGFEKDSCTIEINVWSQGEKCTKPELSEAVAVRKLFEENGGAVAWIEPHRTVAGMLNGKTVILQIGNSTAYIDGTSMELTSAPYIADESTYVEGSVINAVFE